MAKKIPKGALYRPELHEKILDGHDQVYLNYLETAYTVLKHSSDGKEPTNEELFQEVKSIFSKVIEFEERINRTRDFIPSREELEITRAISDEPEKLIRELFSENYPYKNKDKLSATEWLLHLTSRIVLLDYFDQAFYGDEIGSSCDISFLEYLAYHGCNTQTNEMLEFYQLIREGKSIERHLAGEPIKIFDHFDVQNHMWDLTRAKYVSKYTLEQDLLIETFSKQGEVEIPFPEAEMAKAFPKDPFISGGWASLRYHRRDKGLDPDLLDALRKPQDIVRRELQKNSTHFYNQDSVLNSSDLILGGSNIHRILVDFSAPDEQILKSMKMFLKEYRKEFGLQKPKNRTKTILEKLADYRVLEYIDIELICWSYRIKISDRAKAEIVFGDDVCDNKFNQTLKPFINSATTHSLLKTLASNLD